MQKIHFFTGKGGVGKSTIAAAFAKAQVEADKVAKNKSTVLLAELSEEKLIDQFIKPDLAGLTIESWTTQTCLTEYAANLIKSETLTKLFLNNSVSKSLIDIAPGLQELAILGKATATPRKHGPGSTSDNIFIDSFATGHFIQMMSSPQSFTEIFTKGPMATQSQSINQWIHDFDFCHIYLVTTADELSLTETMTLHKKLTELQFKPRIILNKFLDLESSKIKTCGRKTKAYFTHLISQQMTALIEIKKVDPSYLQIPFSYEEKINLIVTDLAKSVTRPIL